MAERRSTERRMGKSNQVTGSSNVTRTYRYHPSENVCNHGRSKIFNITVFFQTGVTFRAIGITDMDIRKANTMDTDAYI